MAISTMNVDGTRTALLQYDSPSTDPAKVSPRRSRQNSLVKSVNQYRYLATGRNRAFLSLSSIAEPRSGGRGE